MSSPASDPANERHRRVREIVAEFLRETDGTKSSSVRAWIARHPDLMPELAEQLHVARLIAAAGTSQNAAATTGMGGDSSLKIRCPHCQEDVVVDTEVDWSDVTCQSCGSSFGLIGDEVAASDLRPGQCVGRFELLRRLGQGGFGTVWEALDPHLDRNVALKIPRRGELTAAEAELFLREARSAAQIRHPQIVAIHEVGRVGDRIYLVSDFIPGESLAEKLAGARYSLRKTVELTATLARALHHVHEHNVVHRDLKPANILLDHDGRPHLTDFGLARRVTGDMTLTCDGQIVGTPAYMSPEQARGDSHAVDRLSDIYSLGGILYELLSGELPFRGTPQAMVQQLLRDEPRSPRRLNPRISRDLETICLKCLEKEPRRRYQTAVSLAEDLERVQRGEPIAARPVSRLMRIVRWGHRKPVAAALVATLILVAVAAPIAAMRYRGLAHREAAARETAESLERRRREELYVSKMFAIQYACETHDVHRADQLLQSLIPEPNEPDLRGFEWYYWRQQTKRGLLWELGPFGRLETVTVDPDGELVAFGGHDGIVFLKNLQTDESYEKEMVDQNGRPVAIYALAFSPDSRWLAVGTSGQTVRILDVSTREVVRRMETEGGWIRDLEFSRDGKLLAAALQEGGNVELWTDLDPSTHRVIHVTDTTVRSLTISRDATRIATVGGPYYGPTDGELRLVDVDSGRILLSRDTELKRGWGIQFSPDQLSLVNPNHASAIDIIDTANLDTIRTLSYDSKSGIDPIAISPDGQLLVAGGKNGALMSCSLSDGQLANTWPGHFDQITAISLFPDGDKMVTCSFDGFVKCWNLNASDDARWLTELPGEVRWLRFSDDGNTVYLACYDTHRRMCVQARQVESDAVLWEIEEANVHFASGCLTPNGQILVLGMGEGEVRFVDTASGDVVDRRREHRQDRFIASCCISSDGRWLATGDGPAVELGRTDALSEDVVLWDLPRRQAVGRWRAHDRKVRLMLFGPGHDELVTYGWDKCIRRWRIPTGQLIAEYSMGIKMANGLAFASGHGTLVAVDADGCLWRWSLPEGVQQPVIRSRKGSARAPWMYGPDHTLLIPLGPGDVQDLTHGSLMKFVDTRTWEAKMILDVGPGGVTAVAMSPDGSMLLAGDAVGNVYRWRVVR